MDIISRKEAFELGLTQYYTGKPCKHGHIALRATVNSTCLQCASLMSAENYQKNKDKIKKRVQERYIENSDKIKSYTSAYAKRNKKRTNARHRRRYKEDPAYKMSFLMRRWVRKLLIKTSQEDKNPKLGYSAADLKSHIENLFVDGMSWDNHGEWHIDHVVPIAKWLEWGIDDPKIINCLENLQPLWASENLAKGTNLPE